MAPRRSQLIHLIVSESQIYIYIYISMYVYIYIYVFHTYMHTHTHIYICIVHMYIHAAHIYIYVYNCACVLRMMIVWTVFSTASKKLLRLLVWFWELTLGGWVWPLQPRSETSTVPFSTVAFLRTLRITKIRRWRWVQPSRCHGVHGGLVVGFVAPWFWLFLKTRGFANY